MQELLLTPDDPKDMEFQTESDADPLPKHRDVETQATQSVMDASTQFRPYQQSKGIYAQCLLYTLLVLY